jgi:hypothetical protein
MQLLEPLRLRSDEPIESFDHDHVKFADAQEAVPLFSLSQWIDRLRLTIGPEKPLV